MNAIAWQSGAEGVRRASAESVAQRGGPVADFVAGHDESRAGAVRDAEALANQSAQAKSTAAYQSLLNEGLAQRRAAEKQKKKPAQRASAEEHKKKPAQREPMEKDKRIQRMSTGEPSAVQLEAKSSQKPNDTGLPDHLKSGIESLSGLSMDGVKVHYNSSQPAQIQAHAYTQGSDIHVAPGQERHLPHEAWHVVQQLQGRVQATTQLKGVALNDDAGLEREADVMGARANERLAAPAVAQRQPRWSSGVRQRREANLLNYARGQRAMPVYFAAGTYANDHVFEQDLQQFNTVGKFVSAAAAEAGAVGSMPEILHATQYTRNGNAPAFGQEKWVTSSEDMGKSTQPHSIEPFNIELMGQYSVANTAASMIYHFGNFNNGYIVAQTDGVQDAKIRDYPSASKVGTVEYSNVHVNTDDVADTGMDVRMTGNLAHEEAWDARTILGGEGARFAPVRALHDNGTLANTSRFFSGLDAQPATLNDDLVACITLRDLWGIWSRRFAGQFNISAATIAPVLRQYSKESSDRIDILELQDMTNGTDFDLDRDAVH